MSSFDDVKAATCKVLGPDGLLAGTAFAILADGYLLTCDHVVAPLERVFVATSDSEQVEAEYLGELSTPRNDVAVLRVPGLALPAVQVGRMPERGEGFGYGFRPKTLSMGKYSEIVCAGALALMGGVGCDTLTRGA